MVYLTFECKCVFDHTLHNIVEKILTVLDLYLGVQEVTYLPIWHQVSLLSYHEVGFFDSYMFIIYVKEFTCCGPGFPIHIILNQIYC